MSSPDFHTPSGTMTTRAGCSTCTRSRESGTSTRSFTSSFCGGGNCRICLRLRPRPQCGRQLPPLGRQFHRALRRRRRRASLLHAVCNRSSRSSRGSRRRASRRKRPATASGREGMRRRSRRKLKKVRWRSECAGESVVSNRASLTLE